MTRAGVVALGVLAACAVAGSAHAALAPTRISTDTFLAGVPGAHATEVEPSAVAAGPTIVSVFQVGRNFGGGASGIGFATSRDGGTTWTSGLLPGLTTWTATPGPYTRASDPVVAYDAAHNRFLAATLAFNAIGVNGSADGTDWGAPVFVSTGPSDKEWIVCDSWGASRFRGRCYLAYTRFDPPGVNLRIAVQTSSDGGVTWGPQVIIPVDNSVLRFEDVISAQPVVRPNGELVVVFLEGPRARAARSTDGGGSFAAVETIASVSQRYYSFAPERLRGPNIPSVAVDALGTLYVVWYDCRYRVGCSGNDIVLAQSAGAGAWTEPIKVPLGGGSATADFLLPAVAVELDTGPLAPRLALTYHVLSAHDCAGAGCELRAGFALRSAGSRRAWISDVVGDGMSLDWLAPTSLGRMVGDYVAAVFVPGRAVAVLSLALAPNGGRFDQAIVAASRPAPDPPTPVRKPRISGVPRVGRALTCHRGTWVGTPPIRFAFGWLRSGVQIPGARSARYVVRPRDRGARLACRVRASNVEGTAEVTIGVRVRR